MLRKEGLETDSERLEIEEHAQHLLCQLEPIEEEVDVVGGVCDGVAVAQVASATDAADLSEVIENCP